MKHKHSFAMPLRKKIIYYAVIAVCVIALAVGATFTIISLNNNKINVEDPNKPSLENPDDKPTTNPDDPADVPSSTVTIFAFPVQEVNITNNFGFYHNSTLNYYGDHTGIDFSAEVGAKVYSAYAGTIESITDDILTGTQIIIDHGDGLKSSYSFVDAVDSLKVGKAVTKGEIIATVAKATGSEYKEGAHLHFEIVKNNVNVNPETYLTTEEK